MFTKLLVMGLVAIQAPVVGVPAAPMPSPLPTSGFSIADVPADTGFQNLDGYQTDTYQIEVSPGQGPVGMRWSDRARTSWGSSYATST